MLLVSESNAGKLDLELDDLELRAVAQESLESSRPLAMSRGIDPRVRGEAHRCMSPETACASASYSTT